MPYGGQPMQYGQQPYPQPIYPVPNQQPYAGIPAPGFAQQPVVAQPAGSRYKVQLGQSKYSIY